MNQRIGIMRACEYSIESLKGLRKTLLDIDLADKGNKWACAGILITLTANLIKMIDEVIADSFASGEDTASRAHADIQEIQTRFNALIEGMLNNG